MRHAPTTTGWTKEDDKRLCEMRYGGATYIEIGKILGRSPTAARGRFYILNGPVEGGYRRFRPLGPALQPDEIKPPEDEAFVAACIAGGGFPAMKLKPGRVFSYRNGERIEVTL